MKTAENKANPRIAQASQKLGELRAFVARGAWVEAGRVVDSLRYGYGYTYAAFAREFGAERWEDIAAEIDSAESAAE